MPALNEQFGKMAALAPQKQQCEFGSYYPAASAVEAATSQSRLDVRRHSGDSTPKIESE